MKRSDRILLIAIAAAGLLPRLWLGMHHGIEYDGWWHLFIARQDHFATFRSELFRNAHPALYYLLLKLVLPWSESILAYRSVSLLAGVLSIYAFGSVAFRTIVRRPLALLASAAFGFSISSIGLSIEIRAYTAATLMFLLATGPLIDLATSGEREGRAGKRIAFAVSASCAILLQYATVLALSVAVAVAALFSMRRRRQSTWRPSQLLPDALAAALPFAIFAILYLVHARHWAHPLSHLPQFYLASSGLSPSEFVIFGLGALAKTFSPINPLGGAPVLAMVSAVTALAMACFETKAGRDATAMIHWILVLLLVALAAGGIVGIHPFGGEMRQQYLLFPFLVLSAFAALDRITSGLRPERARTALVVALAAGVTISAAWQFRSFHVNPRKQFEPALDRLLSKIPESRLQNAPFRSAVWVDQFSLIVFFSRHHSAKWRFRGWPAGNGEISSYRLSSDGAELLVLRDRSRWTLNLGEPNLYRDIALNARAAGVPKVVIASMDQTRQRRVDAQTLRWIDERSRAAGLLPERIESDGACVLAVFALADTGMPQAGQLR